MMDFAAARRLMVETQVRPNDVTDARILDALETIPRERFLPSGSRDKAYVERELDYAPGRSMITPRDFAKLLSALAPQPGDVALDAACGTGYSTAVLSMLCEMAVAVESDEALATSAQEAWAELDRVNTAAIVGDPKLGAPGQGPFDVILIAQAIEVAPVQLIEQLKDGGRLAAIVLEDGVARGVIFSKTDEAWSSRASFDATARTVAPEFQKPRVFAF